METKKVPFFIKVKRAIFNFDEYSNFAMEKLRKAITYYIILMIIFSLCISITLTYKMYNSINDIVSKDLETIIPDFRFENNELIIEEQEKIVVEDESNFLGITIDSEQTDIEYLEHEYEIVLLKDKIILNYTIIDSFGISPAISYEDLFNDYDMGNMTKQSVIEYLNSENMMNVYSFFFAYTMTVKFIMYSLVILSDILLLAILGFLVSRIFRLNLKFKPIFSMSFYAMTLSIILYMIYIIVNTLTGFDIKYFRLAYDAISYIYIITAILMIKSDLIKQQMELMRIVEVQKQVKQEIEEQKEEEERKDKEKSKEESKDNKGNEKKDKELQKRITRRK